MTKHFWRNLSMSYLMLLFIMPLSHARETDRGTVIYEQGSLLVTVYGWAERPGRKLADFCSGKKRMKANSYNVSVTYDVPHKERTKLITPSYEGFVRDKVYPSLIKTCGAIDITEIVMSMSKTGEYTRQDWRDTMTFAVADNGKTITQTNYHPNSIAKANMSMEEIAALMPSQTNSTSSSPQKIGKELFNDGKITIYAREDIWCTSKDLKRQPSSTAGLDIIVPVSYSELKSWLHSHYENFDNKVIKPLVDKTCFQGGRINAKFYQNGQSAYLEDVSYGWKTPKAQFGIFNPSPSNAKQFTALSREAGQTREAKLAAIKEDKEELDVWDMPCQGKFCILPGGSYLQAIHDGDLGALKRMDGIVDSAIIRWVHKSLGEAIAANKHQDYSLLPVIADTYFYNYQHGFMLSCPDNLYQKTYRYKNPTFEMPDYKGLSMPDMGGEIDSATYVVPKQFLPLCDKICDAFGGSQDRLPIKSMNIKPARATLNSVYEIFDKYRCDQKEIKHFEKNLIKFTEEYLKNKDSWLSQHVKQTVQGSTKSEAVEQTFKQPVQNTQQDTIHPSAQPAPLVTSNTPDADTQKKATPEVHQGHSKYAPTETKSQRGEAKRYEQMNAELAALSELYTARLHDLSAEFKKNMLNTSDASQRTEILKEFQARVAELNAEATRETYKVKEKYNK